MQQRTEKEYKDQEPFVSVLTPVYNGAEFLRECIESVLNQSYSNWEYVLVNNQSTDQSLEIIEEYAAIDKRIRIHNNEDFLPQMQNLNHAFRQISPESKYCKVVHADDWLFPDCIAKMVEVNEEYPTVGIVSAYRLNDEKVGLDGLSYPSNFNDGREIARNYLMNGTSYFGSPSSLLICSDLIRKRDKFYIESHMASDTGACLEVLKESDFGFVHDVLTFTRDHEMSISNTACRENYSFIYARLYSKLEYGPYFLSEEECEKALADEMNFFYILLARNLMQKKSIDELQRQLNILNKLGIEFERQKFLKKLIREFFLHTFRMTGLDIIRKSTKADHLI